MMYTGKQLRALVMPLMFEQFLNVMVGMVDTLMVSKAGEAAVSGVALTTNINLLIIQVMAARQEVPSFAVSTTDGVIQKMLLMRQDSWKRCCLFSPWQQRLFVLFLESRCYRQSLEV